MLCSALMERVRLFVYGSLRRGHEHHAELDGARYVGAAVTEPRYRIIQRGAYPALVAGTDAVKGEVYAVESETLARLDAFEGEDYRRASVQLVDGSAAEAYFLAETIVS